MKKKCDIKESAEAYNTGVDALEKSFMLTGNTTKSFRYAISEIQSKHPEFDFEISSFVDPIVSGMKEKGLLDKSYKFGSKKKVLSEEEKKDANEAKAQQKQIEKETLQERNKIEKAVEKFNGLNQDQKKSLAKKMYEKFDKDGTLTNDEIQNLYADAVGIPSMTDDIKSLIKESSSAMKEYDTIDSEIQSIYNEIDKLKKDQDGKITKDQDKDLIAKIKALAIRQQETKTKVNRAQMNLAQSLREKSFWAWDLADNIRMNLMTPVSLLKNLTGAAFDLTVRQPKNLVSGALSAMINPITEKKYGTKSGRIGSRFIGGLMNADKSFKNSMESWGYGRTEFDRRLPASDYLNAVTAYKKFVDSNGKQKVINGVALALKVTPDFIKRTLGATDAFFYDNFVRSELESIATQKGLTGAEKQLFLLNPDQDSVDSATKLAEEVTFRSDNKLTKKLNYNPRDRYKKLVAEGSSPFIAKIRTGLSAWAVTMVAPFIKTPVNIVRMASRYLLPEYEMGRAAFLAVNAKNGNDRQQILVDGIAHAAVGYYLRSVAFQAIAAGAVTAGFGDEERKTLDVIEQQLGGANRINWSAVLRIMTGGDGKFQKGDKTVDLNSLGLLGVVFGTYARTYNKYSEEEKKDQVSFSRALAHPAELGLSLLGSSLDLTFLSGTNQLLEAMKSDTDKTNKYILSLLSSTLGGIEPSTVQKLSMSKEANKKQAYDKDKTFGENVANMLGYKFLFQGGNDMKNKYYSLAEEGEALKKKDYMLFDNYLGRVLQEELGVFKSKDISDGPIKKLLDSASQVEKESRDKMFPNSVDKKQTFGKGKNSVSVTLTPEQHEFLMDKASTFRMIAATPYINSEDFDNDSYEVRAETLQRLYRDGLESAKNVTLLKYNSELKEGGEKASDDADSVKTNYKKYGKKKKRSK